MQADAAERPFQENGASGWTRTNSAPLDQTGYDASQPPKRPASDVTALPKPGTPAPPFELAGLDGPALVFPGAASARATLLFFVKHDCATCALVAPVVEELHRTLGSHGLRTVAVSQSDARETREFLTANELSMPAVLDVDLDVSDQYGFDAVPAPVLTTSDGRVLASFEGWVRADWQTVIRAALAACEATDVSTSGLDAASAPLPESRPGCGSRAHDPDVARRLAVKRGSERLAARRVRIPVGVTTRSSSWPTAVSRTGCRWCRQRRTGSCECSRVPPEPPRMSSR